jgi:hypothetical protein
LALRDLPWLLIAQDVIVLLQERNHNGWLVSRSARISPETTHSRLVETLTCARICSDSLIV